MSIARIIGPENVYGKYEIHNQILHAMIPPDEFLGHFFGQPLARISETRYPGQHDEKHQSFTDLSPDFNAYHFLNRLIYIVSNRLVENTKSDASEKQWTELFDMLTNRISRTVVVAIFSTNYLSIRATWEISLNAAYRSNCSDALAFLIEVALDTHEDWIKGYADEDMLFFAAKSRNATLVQIFLDRGALPYAVRDMNSYGVKEDAETAITVAAKRGAWDCMRLLVEACDPNSGLSAPATRSDARYPLRAPISNFHFYLHFVEVQLSEAWMVNPDDGLYFLSEHTRIEKLTPCMEGLDLFLRAGANVDLPCFLMTAHRIFQRGRPALLHVFHDVVKTPLEWYPTILDLSLYWDEQLFNILHPHSLSYLITDQVTRSGVCKAALQGRSALDEYLFPKPPPCREFMELLLAEQFFMHLWRPYGPPDMVNRRLARSFIEYGVSINSKVVKDCGGVNLLLQRLVASARDFGFDEDFLLIMKHLLREGATMSAETLQLGVQSKGVQILEILAQHNANVGQDGKLALLYAARQDNIQAVQWLLEKGVDVNSEFDHVEGHSHPITLIGAAVLGYKSPNSDRDGPLAANMTLDSFYCSSSIHTMQFLVEKGANLKLHASDPGPYEFFMVKGVHYALKVELMADNPAEIATLSDSEWQSICNYLCSSTRALEIFKSMHRPFDSSPILANVIFHGGSHDVIEDLLEASLNIDYCSVRGQGMTPLQAAAYCHNEHVVLRLLDLGANINAPASRYGHTALSYVCLSTPNSLEGTRQRNSLVELLIARGADCNAINSMGRTALHICTEFGDIRNSILLLEHGADPNLVQLPDEWDSRRADFIWFGTTALDDCVWSGRLDLTHILLKVGGLSAHPGSTGYDGSIRRAELKGHSTIAEVIRRHMVVQTEEFCLNPELLEKHQVLLQQQILRRAEAKHRWSARIYADSEADSDDSTVREATYGNDDEELSHHADDNM